MRPLLDTLVTTDVGNLDREIQQLFHELSRAETGKPAAPSQCLPLVDVFETDQTVEVLLDVPGVPADRLRIMVKGEIVLVVGEKQRPDPPPKDTFSFHLVERAFGRFARAVRLKSAFDASRVRARLRAGELRIVLPKIQERRGREFLVPIETDAVAPSPDAP